MGEEDLLDLCDLSRVPVMGQRQTPHLAAQSQGCLSKDRLSCFSYLPFNELLEHIPSEVLTNLLNVWLWGESWELVTKSVVPQAGRAPADLRREGLIWAGWGQEEKRPARTWKRSGGTCFFTRWPWTCSVAFFEKGWRGQRWL